MSAVTFFLNSPRKATLSLLGHILIRLGTSCFSWVCLPLFCSLCRCRDIGRLEDKGRPWQDSGL